MKLKNTLAPTYQMRKATLRAKSGRESQHTLLFLELSFHINGQLFFFFLHLPGHTNQQEVDSAKYLRKIHGEKVITF